MSSWQTLQQSFSQCQSFFSQRSSITVASQSVQRLYASYQAAVSQYESCSACSSYLSQGGYSERQIQQSVTEMYSSFQSIILTGQEYCGEQWQSQFASTFQRMSYFGSFSEEVCSSAGLNLSGLLGNIGLNLNVFANSGINLGINLGLGPAVGLLGGGGGHGLLG